jgi:hypothetical protein
MMLHTIEADLTQSVQKYLHRKGYLLQTTELQFYEYSIDIYGLSLINNRTVAIELKIKNWKRALNQTLIYQLCSDLVIMAMPKETIRRVNVDLLEREGIGLLWVNPNNCCRMVLQPQPSLFLKDTYKRRNISFLQRKEKENAIF